MASRGVVAAGHPLTAEAGADALRAGGNAIDAAVAAVLASTVCESPLTGLGAGGFMIIHTPQEDVVLDFFVAAPGQGVDLAGRAELIPITIDFGGTRQVFNVGAASCGVHGVPAGLAEALRRHGTLSLSDLADGPAKLAREGVVLNQEQAYLIELLTPIYELTPECAAIYTVNGQVPKAGDRLPFPELADALELYGQRGPDPFYTGEIGTAMVEWIGERGGVLSREDLANYEVIARRPVESRFGGRRVLSNPPPSSGGLLISYTLALLERLDKISLEEIVMVMEAAQAARTPAFHSGLYEQGYDDRFLDPERISEAAELLRGGSEPLASPEPEDRLGSTTHITAIDSGGCCASVTCSNGSGSGIVVPGTGVQPNNMLGEEDLSPLGFHSVPIGRRITSMMAPTVVLGPGGELEAALGSGGSNRIRSAILQSVLRLLVDEMAVGDAVAAPRVHFENGVLEAEPGIDPGSLKAVEALGYQVNRWQQQNLFFGGAHAVTRDPLSGLLAGGGDPRRGGAVAVA